MAPKWVPFLENVTHVAKAILLPWLGGLYWGVEAEDSFALLDSMNCSVGQAFYYQNAVIIDECHFSQSHAWAQMENRGDLLLSIDFSQTKATIERGIV